MRRRNRGALLPHLFTVTIRTCHKGKLGNGRLFSVALSVGLPRLVVNQHPAQWSSDFPLVAKPPATIQPTPMSHPGYTRLGEETKGQYGPSEANLNQAFTSLLGSVGGLSSVGIASSTWPASTWAAGAFSAGICCSHTKSRWHDGHCSIVSPRCRML